MTTRTTSLLSMICLASLSAFGCGSDESEAVSGIDSGVSPDKPVAALTLIEGRQLCEATLDAISEIFPQELQIEHTCSIAGSALSIAFGLDGMPRLDQAACERHRATCLAEVEVDDDVVETRHCSYGTLAPGRTCMATVAEFEQCAAASLRAAATYMRQNSTCAALAAQPIAVFPNTSAMMPVIHVPECTAFEAKCGDIELPMNYSGNRLH